MRRRWRCHGDVFSSNFPYYGRVVYVADPAEVKRVFTGDPTICSATIPCSRSARSAI
jgi:hypothetical protein